MLIPKRLSPFPCCPKKTDINVVGGSFDPSTLVLTLVQDDEGPTIEVDLGELSKSYTDDTESVTFEGDGTSNNPLKATSLVEPVHYFSVNDDDTELGNYDNEASNDAGLGAMVIGPNSTATTAGTVVIGHDASSDRKGSQGFTDVDGDVVIGQFASSKSTAGAFPANYGADFLTQPNIVIGRNANADVPAGSAILIGVDTVAEVFAGTAIGYRAKVSGVDGSNYYGSYGLQGGCTAIGSFTEAIYSGELQGNLPDDNTSSCPTAFGSLSKALADGAGAFGDCSQALALRATCIGSMSQATEQHSVAVGSLSIANRGVSTDTNTESGYGGYNPATGGFGGDTAIDDTVSTHSAVSVGKNTDSRIEFTVNYTDAITDTIFTQVGNIRRQIINVAAGTKDTDAVNVAQLKAVSEIKHGFYLNRAGRAYLYTDERWVSQADDNYGTQYVNFSESAGNGTEPMVEWENRGDIIYAGTHVHSVTVMGRINSVTDISDLILAAYFVYPDGEDVLTTTGASADTGMIATEMGRMMYVEGGSDDKPLTGALSKLYRRTLTLDFIAPNDGELRLFYKPVSSESRSGGTRFLVHSSSWLLSH